MIPARQSTALELAIGPVLDADGVAVTDCVVGDFKIKKTTGNFAAINGSATLTHVSAGVYDLVLTTSDTDTVGLCAIAIDDTVNTCASIYLQVIEEAVYDAHYAASAVGYVADQPVNTTKVGGTSQTGADVGFLVTQIDTNIGTILNKLEGLVIVSGTVGSTGNSTTTVHVVGTGAWVDDALNDYLLVIFDASDDPKVSSWITDFDQSSELATIETISFTPASGDTYWILPFKRNVIDSADQESIADSILARFADDVGTAQAGGGSTITLRSGAVATDDYYAKAVVTISGGTGIGQSRRINSYVGSTKVATVDEAWVTNPDSTSEYFVIGRIS